MSRSGKPNDEHADDEFLTKKVKKASPTVVLKGGVFKNYEEFKKSEVFTKLIGLNWWTGILENQNELERLVKTFSFVVGILELDACKPILLIETTEEGIVKLDLNSKKRVTDSTIFDYWENFRDFEKNLIVLNDCPGIKVFKRYLTGRE